MGAMCGPVSRRMSARRASARAPGAVDLVDEYQCREPGLAQGAHQDAGLRLYALHGGQDGTAPSSTPSARSTSAMKSLCPGVSIRLTWVSPTPERRDRGAHGDAALPLDGVGVGLRRPGVHAAEPVNSAGVVEQPLGQAGLARRRRGPLRSGCGWAGLSWVRGSPKVNLEVWALGCLEESAHWLLPRVGWVRLGQARRRGTGARGVLPAGFHPCGSVAESSWGSVPPTREGHEGTRERASRVGPDPARGVGLGGGRGRVQLRHPHRTPRYP